MNLYLTPACMRVLISPYPVSIGFSFFVILVIVGIKQYLTVVLIYSSLMTNNVEHLFICLLAIYTSFLQNYVFKSISHFLDHLYFYWVVKVLCRWVICKYSLSFCGLSRYLDRVLRNTKGTKSLNFCDYNLSVFCDCLFSIFKLW